MTAAAAAHLISAALRVALIHSIRRKLTAASPSALLPHYLIPFCVRAYFASPIARLRLAAAGNSRQSQRVIVRILSSVTSSRDRHSSQRAAAANTLMAIKSGARRRRGERKERREDAPKRPKTNAAFAIICAFAHQLCTCEYSHYCCRLCSSVNSACSAA